MTTATTSRRLEWDGDNLLMKEGDEVVRHYESPSPSLLEFLADFLEVPEKSVPIEVGLEVRGLIDLPLNGVHPAIADAFPIDDIFITLATPNGTTIKVLANSACYFAHKSRIDDALERIDLSSSDDYLKALEAYVRLTCDILEIAAPHKVQP